MQSAEDFFGEYLREKRKNLEVFSGIQDQLHQKYFGADLLQRHLAFSKAIRENPPRIVSVDTVGDCSKIIWLEKTLKFEIRHRHILFSKNGNWRIENSQMECFVCKGTGRCENEICKHCEGVGWQDLMKHSL
jgi:hypothetical protein